MKIKDIRTGIDQIHAEIELIAKRRGLVEYRLELAEAVCIAAENLLTVVEIGTLRGPVEAWRKACVEKSP